MDDMEMVTGMENNRKKKQQEKEYVRYLQNVEIRMRHDRRTAFLRMVIHALLWVLAGLTVLLLMVNEQIAIWLAGVCVCACAVSAGICIDRSMRG